MLIFSLFTSKSEKSAESQFKYQALDEKSRNRCLWAVLKDNRVFLTKEQVFRLKSWLTLAFRLVLLVKRCQSNLYVTSCLKEESSYLYLVDASWWEINTSFFEFLRTK